MMEALIFDCDGVLVDTERDGHRVAFNQSFAEFGLTTKWTKSGYARWLLVGGGKERLTAYFNEMGWPGSVENRADFIADLHARKTALFLELIQTGRLPLRPGVARLMDEAIAKKIPVAVCSTSNRKSVQGIVDRLLGASRASVIRVFAGDMAKRKKPDPEIYQLATRTLRLSPTRCVVIEDSRIGLLAAKAAGMHCLVTRSTYTVDEDFSTADAVVDSLDDGPLGTIRLTDLIALTLT